jgi:hypothetical protein
VTIPGWYWIVWVAVMAISFAIPEAIALKNRVPGDTLSEWTRSRWRTYTKGGRWVWALVWAAFTFWFGIHIADGPL